MKLIKEKNIIPSFEGKSGREITQQLKEYGKGTMANGIKEIGTLSKENGEIKGLKEGFFISAVLGAGVYGVNKIVNKVKKTRKKNKKTAEEFKAIEQRMRYCNGCGEFLNDQDGYNSSEKVWTCTKCGTVNWIYSEPLTLHEATLIWFDHGLQEEYTFGYLTDDLYKELNKIREKGVEEPLEMEGEENEQ